MKRIFQSTQPSQAVTGGMRMLEKDIEFQSTQPSQAVTPGLTVLSNTLYISIHTALAGCDLVHHVQYHAQLIFQSTQPSQAVTN